jgi:hypothetical protein
MLLVLALAFLITVIALRRPIKNRLFRGRYRRITVVHFQPLRPTRERVSDPTAGIRDPARPF